MPSDSVDVGAYPWPLAEPLWRHGVQHHFDLIHGPAVEPLILGNGVDDDGVKTHLRVRHNREDDYIARLIKVARQACEYWTRRALVPQTWVLNMDRFPRARGSWGLSGFQSLGIGSAAIIRIDKPPVISVDEITYIDMQGVTQQLDLTDAFLQTDFPRGPYAGYGRLRPIPDKVWPDTQRHRLDAVRIRFQCGYPDSTSPSTSPPTHTIPDELLQGMLIMIGEMYKTREASVNAVNMPAMVTTRLLWSAYRCY